MVFPFDNLRVVLGNNYFYIHAFEFNG